MIANDILQKAIVARLKADGPLVAALNGSNKEVREQQWQGRNFTYPAVRVALGTQMPRIEMTPCEWARLSFSILCLSEEHSSQQTDNIAGLVNAALHKQAWTVTADGFRFHFIRSAGLNSAIRMSERVWRAEAFFITDLHTV